MTDEIMALAPKKIYSDMVALRRLVGGLKAEKREGGPRFAVKDARVLMEKIREAADTLNMPIAGGVVAQTVEHYPVREVTDKYGAVKYFTVVHVVATVRFMSDDGTFLDFVGSGHGMDDQDKAGGKASTYAWKDAIIKGAAMPDAEMVDTDDVGDVMPAGRSKVAPFIDRANRAESLEELKDINKEFNEKRWGPTENDMFRGCIIKNKGRFATKTLQE